MNCEFAVENEIYTNAKDEEELKIIFNDKLATLILYFQEKVEVHCDNAINAV